MYKTTLKHMLMTIKKFSVFIFPTILYLSCEDSAEDFAKYNSGKKKYDEKCQSCHNINSNTTYHPSLLEMQSLDWKALEKKLLRIKRDENHTTFLGDFSNDSINQIKYFIIHYKSITQSNDDTK